MQRESEIAVLRHRHGLLFASLRVFLLSGLRLPIGAGTEPEEWEPPVMASWVHGQIGHGVDRRPSWLLL